MFVCILSGSQVLVLPCGPGFGHPAADPGAGQASTRHFTAAGTFTVPTDATAATPAASAHAPLPAAASQPALLPRQASPADPALLQRCPGSGVPAAHGSGAGAAFEAFNEAGADWRNTAGPSSIHC